MIIGLTGTNAAGKSTVAEYLVGKHFAYYSLSDELRLLLRQKGAQLTRDNLIKAANTLRQRHGSGFLAELVAKRLRGSPSVVSAVVDSIRNLAEIATLRQFGDFYLIAVDAPVDIRFERVKKRGSLKDVGSFSQFMHNERKEMLGKDTEQQLGACINEADYKVVNDGDFKKLYKQIDTVLLQVTKKAAAKK